MAEGKKLTEPAVIHISEYQKEEEKEESAVIVGQRYLNIFHQMHIFGKAQKKEFNRSLLEMPGRVRKILPTLPGGRMLLEYVEELEEKEQNKDKDVVSLSKTKKQDSDFQFQPNTLLSPMLKAPQVDIGSDFAQNLADSLSQAFKENLSLEKNFRELTSALNQSFDASSKNIQQLTKLQEQNIEIFSHLKADSKPIMLPVYGVSNKKGNIVIDKTASSKKVMCPAHLVSKPDIYAVSLCTNRLGSLLPAKSVLFVDPNEIVGSGDIALFYINETETALLSIREDENGQLYGLRLNPDEKISIPSKEISLLHRVVFINL